MVPGDLDHTQDVFLRDRATGTTSLVSGSPGASPSTGYTNAGPSISANGRYVAFVSNQSDLVDGDNNGLDDVFVRDLVTGSYTLLSRAFNGNQSNGRVVDVVLSADGRYVAFGALATNLDPGDTNSQEDVFEAATGVPLSRALR